MHFSRLWPWGREIEPAWPEAVPTVVHVTHPKAGSTWLDRIFRKACGPLVAPRGTQAAMKAGVAIADYVFPQGRIHPAQFMYREAFLQHEELRAARRFVVIRDLRDTFVSMYFSIKHSHPDNERVLAARREMEGMSQAEGMRWLLGVGVVGTANLQMSWMNAGECILRYEELLGDDVRLLTELFIQRLGLPIEPERLRRIVEANRFEARFGRPLGVEDVRSHGRQGAPGNWRRHMDRGMAEEFAERFGEVLVATGYETDGEWVKGVGE